MNAMYGLRVQAQPALIEKRNPKNARTKTYTSHGITTLKGTLSTGGARETAGTIARSLSGETRVMNELDVT